MNTLELNDLELTALMIHFEGYNEVECEARANDDSNTPLTTRDIITDKVSQKVYDLYYKTTKNPNFNESKLLDALLRK
jgi:hypothetical protein